MQSGRFGFRRVLHGPASSQWVIHTAEQFPGAPSHAAGRPTWRVASVHMIQEDATTASGFLLLYADLPTEALAQLTRELSYTLVGADDALYLDCVRATELGTVELLGEVRRIAVDAAEAAAEEDDRPRPQQPSSFRAGDASLH